GRPVERLLDHRRVPHPHRRECRRALRQLQPLPNQGFAGSTTGGTYAPTALGNMFLFDSNLTGSLSPTSTQSPASTSSAIGAVIRVSTSTPPLPTVTTISPTNGPTGGGTAVSVTGTNFATGDTVHFGTVAATGVTIASASS